MSSISSKKAVERREKTSEMEGIFGKMGIDPGIIIIIMLIAMLVLILIDLALYSKVRDVTRKYTIFMRGEDGKSLEKTIEKRFQDVGTVVRAQTTQSYRMQFDEAVMNRSLTKYGIIKYDAFDDVGGKLSFALAMLDKNDSGFVLNAIHSKESCYLYLKEVVKGESYVMLSREEIEALRAAKRYGAEEDAILKYQLDRAIISEKRYANNFAATRDLRKSPGSRKTSAPKSRAARGETQHEENIPENEDVKIDHSPTTRMNTVDLGRKPGQDSANAIPESDLDVLQNALEKKVAPLEPEKETPDGEENLESAGKSTKQPLRRQVRSKKNAKSVKNQRRGQRR